MNRIIFVLLVFSHLASASASVSTLSLNKETPANKTAVSLRTDQYVSSGTNFYRSGAATGNSNFGITLDREASFKGLVGRADFKNEYDATEKWNYLNIYQLYLKGNFAGAKFALGRKLETWNQADADWKQGIVHSRYLQNKVKQEPAGLIGLFASGGDVQKNAAFSIGLLPIYIPDFGAHFTIENSQFRSQNPWFDPPVSSFRFRGQEGAIRYSVKQPPIDEIALKPGALARLEMERKNTGVRVMGAFKPVPQLLLGFPSINKVIVGADEDYLQVDVTPKVMYHWLASSEGYAKLGRWQVGGGVTHDRVVGDAFGSSFTSQEFSPAWIFTLSASRAIGEDGPSAPRVKFGAIKIEGGSSEDSGVFANSQKSLFEKRFQYDEAYMAGLFYPVRGVLRRPIETEARVIYDRLQNGGLLGFALGYQFTKAWRADLELDFIGLVGEDSQVNDGFFSNYRANDRVGVGSSYVF